MINILLGAPGGGKSYEAVVYHVLPALKRGRKVITNLPLNLEAFDAIEPGFSDLLEIRTRSLKGQDAKLQVGRAGRAFMKSINTRAFANPEDFVSEWRGEDGSGPLYIIDECHFCMPKDGTSVEVEEWFSMHRHYNVDVLLITQSAGKISEAIRELIQNCYKVRKAIAFGKPDSYIRKVLDGVNGGEIAVGQRDYLPQYFKLYKSHTKGNAIAEVEAEDVSPFIVKFKRWTWAILALGIVLTIWTVYNAVSKPDPVKLAPRTLTRSNAPQSPPGPPGASVPPGQAQTLAAAEPVLQNGVPEPFGGKQLHLTGSATMGKKTIYQFTVSQNGLNVMQVFDYELQKMGYKWAPLVACAGTLTWGDKSTSITCDTPRVVLGGDQAGKPSTSKAPPAPPSPATPGPDQAKAAQVPALPSV